MLGSGGEFRNSLTVLVCSYVATVQRGKKKLEIKTFWKTCLLGASC